MSWECGSLLVCGMSIVEKLIVRIVALVCTMEQPDWQLVGDGLVDVLGFKTQSRCKIGELDDEILHDQSQTYVPPAKTW